MEISAAIAKSETDYTVFIVKETLFCKVYEKSAWRFNELIKPYKPIKKHIKKFTKDLLRLVFRKLCLTTL